jgi:hypothetical protein
MLGYNSQSIPSVFNPFPFGMSNMTSQLSSSISTTNANPSVGLGGISPPHVHLLFGGGHIPQTNPMIGGQPPFSSGSNPSLNAPRWSAQPGGQVTSYISSFTPYSFMTIMTNTFIKANPPLSSGGSQFHAMGNPQPEAPLVEGSVYNPHYVTFAGMMPIQPFMNQFGGRYYPTGQGHGIYQNPGWPTIPQHQYFLGAWA